MSRHRLYAILAVGAVLLDVIVVLAPDLPDALHIVVGVPALLAAPGYALVTLLWPGRELAGEIRAVFVLAGSLAVLVLVGLLLAFLPVGLTAATTSVSMAIVTVVLVALAQFLAGNRSSRQVDQTVEHSWLRRSRDVVSLVVAVVVAIGAVVLARNGAERADRRTTFTQLYVNPVGSARAVTIGVHSYERKPTRFRLVVRTSGETNRLLKVSSFHLTNNQTTEVDVLLPQGVSRKQVRALLYRAGRAAPYRTVDG